MTTTYCGPQHDAVAALVERARRLTPDETRRLAAAGAAARIADATRYARAATWAARDATWAARDAARAAGAARTAGAAAREAGDATWDATWAATWAATWDATWDATWAARDAAREAGAAAWAAWDAALALATRHLIGQGSYTAEHYAILTHPWRRVIGPIHPDDGILLAEHTHGETP